MLVGIAVLALLAQIAAGRQAPAGYQAGLVALGRRGASSYHEAAREVEDLGERLRSYEKWMGQRFRAQLSTHPAGPLVTFWGLNRVFEGHPEAARAFVRGCEDVVGGGVRLAQTPWAAHLLRDRTAAEMAGLWLGTFVVRLAGCLVVLPAYALGRSLYGRRTALLAAGFAAAVPSLLMFSPALDVCFPVLALSACWLGLTAGQKGSGRRAFAAGLVVSAGLFLSLSFAVVAGWTGLLGVVGLWRGQGRGPAGTWAKLLACGGAGVLVPVGVLYAVVGYNSFAVWRACWEGNAEFNARTQRGYWTWLVLNPLEYGFFLGVPVACLFVARSLRELRALRTKGLRAGDWPTLILAGLLVALDLAGANRGEVARLWMFLMPACAVGAAAEVERLAPYRLAAFAVVFAAQAVQAVLAAASIQVLNIT
ncbi:MAG: glycosyltransferase family 39 protein [Candidatus Brocadiia bacterium]